VQDLSILIVHKIIIIRRRALPPTYRARRPFAVRRNSGCPTPSPIAASCCWITDVNPESYATVYATGTSGTLLCELNCWRLLDPMAGGPRTTNIGVGRHRRTESSRSCEKLWRRRIVVGWCIVPAHALCRSIRENRLTQ